MVESAKKPGQEPRDWKRVVEDMAVTPEEQHRLDEAAAGRSRREAELSDSAEVPPRDPPEDEDVVTDDRPLPPWVVIPDPKTGFRFPTSGKRPFFIRIRRELTDAPQKGDRCVIGWTLTDGEENHATKRGAGDSTRTYKEMTKQMIRAIDGHKVDWSGSVGPGNIAKFWEEIGPVARQLLVNVYHRTHSPSKEVLLDFFISCFDARSVVAG